MISFTVVLKWVESLPSIQELKEEYQEEEQPVQYLQQNYYPYQTEKLPSSAISCASNMPCPNRSTSSRSAYSDKPKPVCPAKSKLRQSMLEKLKHVCPAETEKFLLYSTPFETDQSKKCFSTRQKQRYPTKLHRNTCPILRKKSSTIIKRGVQICEFKSSRLNMYQGKEPNTCPAKQRKMCPTKKLNGLPIQPEYTCPAKKNHTCPAKMNIYPSVEHSVCPSLQQNICPVKSNICPAQQQKIPKMKRVSKVRHTHETYIFPDQEEEYVCPASEPELKITEYFCSRNSGNWEYEDFSCAESEKESDFGEFYEEQYEEASFTDLDEHAPYIYDDVYNECLDVDNSFSNLSQRRFCYRGKEDPRNNCNCD